MAHRFLLFVWMVFGKWQGYVTGGEITALVVVAERLLGKTLPKKVFVIIFILSFLLVSVFVAWREEYTSADWRVGEIIRLSAVTSVQQSQIQQLQSQLAQKEKPIILQYSGDPNLADVLKRFQTEQQETKALSAKDLRDRAIALAGRMRQFEATYQLQESQISDREFAAMRVAKTDDERQQIMQRERNEMTQWRANYQYSFGTTFQGEAIFLHAELLSRIPADKIPTELQKHSPPAFQGMLVGPSPVSEAADWLEAMARILFP